MWELSLNIQAKDLVNSPDELLNMETAFTFIDEICGQVPEGSDPGFPISGAYNMDTGDFMAWGEYISTAAIWEYSVLLGRWAVAHIHRNMFPKTSIGMGQAQLHKPREVDVEWGKRQGEQN